MRASFVDVLTRLGAGWLAALVPKPALLYAVAVGSVIGLFIRRVRQAGYSTDAATAGAATAFFCALIGTRFFYLVASGTLTKLPPEKWFSLQGTQSWGAYLGAGTGLWLYLRWRGVRPLPYFDALASCTALPIVVGRMACFLNGDDFGRITGLPWAVRYPPGSYPFNAHVAAGLLEPTAQASLPTHPLQIYLAVNGLVLFLVVSAIWHKYRQHPGVTLASFLILYGSTRFALEFFRDAAAGGAASGLSVAQWMCGVTVALGGIFLRPHATARDSRLVGLPEQRGT